MEKIVTLHPIDRHGYRPSVEATVLVITGHQLHDALSLIAPDMTRQQLDSVICIQPGPKRMTAHGVEAAGLFCWLEKYPEEGSVRLDETPRQIQAPAPPAGPAPAGADRMYDTAIKLIEAARWVYSNADARRQPEARALAKAVLRLTTPIVNAHMDATLNPSENAL